MTLYDVVLRQLPVPYHIHRQVKVSRFLVGTNTLLLFVNSLFCGIKCGLIVAIPTVVLLLTETMRRTRAAYHYAIRRVKKNETEIVREHFADMILQNKSRDFWSEVQRMKSSKTAVSATVDGVSGCNEIADVC